MKSNPKMSDHTKDGRQSIKELWESIAIFCNSRVRDNTRMEEYNNEYPLDTRIHQMITLKTLVNEIEKFHNLHKEN